MYAMYIPLNIGLHWVLCEVVLPRSSTSTEEEYPTGKLKIYGSLHAGKSAYNEVMNHFWAYRGYADQRDGDEGKASLDAPMGKTAVSWKYLGVAQHSEMPRQGNGIDCGLFTCKAAENLVDCLPLAASGDGSRRGGFSAGPNASTNRRRLIVLIGQDAGWAGIAAAAP
jgi:Ulp1 family protease